MNINLRANGSVDHPVIEIIEDNYKPYAVVFSNEVLLLMPEEKIPKSQVPKIMEILKLIESVSNLNENDFFKKWQSLHEQK